MTSKSKIPLKLKNFVKRSVLSTLTYAKDFFPEPFAGFLLSSLFNIDLKIEDGEKLKGVIICRYKDGAKGALCFSIDFDFPSARFGNIDRVFREATLRILQLADHYMIPFSWGICGDTAVCEPRIFQKIVQSSIKHDLGGHTFSHKDLSNPACSYGVARLDIAEGMKVLNQAGRPVSFIFPWNREGHLATLQELGFIAYRGNQQARISYPLRNKGLWDIHQTYYLSRKSPYELKVILKLLDLAISYGGVFHIWSHPWNLHLDGNVEKFTEKVLIPFFEHAATRRKEGSLWICTMRELANYSEARRNCQIETSIRKGNNIKLVVSCRSSDKGFDFPPTITLRIPLPKRPSVLKVFVDKKEAYPDKNWYTVEKRDARYLYLTLSFEKPTRQVFIQIQGP